MNEPDNNTVVNMFRAATGNPVDGNPTLIAFRYRLLEAIGSGGMGKVFRAVDEKTAHICAMKIMHNHLRTDEINVRRFEREARLAFSLKHENLVSVTDFGVTDQAEPYIVMEFLVGHSLDDLLARHGRLSPSRLLPIVNEVCAGLSFAHRSNVIHRDIKPSNIMLADKGGKEAVKIVDFGIARVCGTTGEVCPTKVEALKGLPASREFMKAETRALLEELTRPGEIFGSPLYMSPEQCFGEEADCRSEVYAIGCLIFKALTGHVPLKGKNASDTVLKRVHGKAPAMGEVASDCVFSTELEMIVARCLDRDPDNRYQTVAELRNVLRIQDLC